MEGINLIFNVDVAKLQQLGVDPTTSEGKAWFVQMFLDGLSASLDQSPGDEPDDELQLDAIRREFLKEI
jgi:hypothetical protein